MDWLNGGDVHGAWWDKWIGYMVEMCMVLRGITGLAQWWRCAWCLVVSLDWLNGGDVHGV